MKSRGWHGYVIALCVAVPVARVEGAQGKRQHTWQAQVLPPEHRVVRDQETGLDLLFVTTNPAPDHNLYFHQRSFLSDDSMLLFTSSRSKGGLMGYLFSTGELVRLTGPQGGIGAATAARHRNSVFGLRGRQVIEVSIRAKPSHDLAGNPSTVTCAERTICTIPDGISTSTDLSENADGTLLACGARFSSGDEGIILIHVRTGRVSELCRTDHAGHVQFSHSSPYLLSFAGIPERLMVVDVREKKPRSIHKQVDEELVTHECWWFDDYMTFCGGYQQGESHVKVINPLTGEVRIVGAGSWWPDGTPAELARWTWWHAAGSLDGRWVAADNWHGDIAIFDGKTTQMRILTKGHRTYGGGDHPHVGWASKGDRVVFTSLRFGNPDVCVVSIPPAW